MALVFGILVGVLLTAMFIWTLVTFRKEKRLTWWGPLASVVGAGIGLPLTLAFTGAKVPWGIGLALWGAGILFGLLWGFTIKIAWRDGVPVGRNSILWVFFFATSYLFVYGLMLFAPAVMVALGSLAAMFPAGMGAGTNLNQLVRVVAKVGAGRAQAAYAGAPQ